MEANKFLSDNGYGSGTNYTTSEVASLMRTFSRHENLELQKRVAELEEAVNQAVELIESGPFRKTKHCTILKQVLKNNLVVNNEEGE